MTTHREVIEKEGRTICSPITGSMRPIIRPKVDCGVFVPADGVVGKYGVVLYGRGKVTVMHRVIGMSGEDYVIRGDCSFGKEYVARDRVFAVMEGFYRGERYVSCENRFYRLLSVLIVAANPLFSAYFRLRRRLAKIPWLRRLYRKIRRRPAF